MVWVVDEVAVVMVQVVASAETPGLRRHRRHTLVQRKERTS